MYYKVVQSGNIIETYAYEKTPVVITRRKKRRTYTNDLSTLSIRRKDNIWRYKKSFLRLVWANLRANDRPALFTFTMLEVVSLEEARHCWRGFVERLRGLQGSLWRFIVVPEFQKRGAVHFHALIWGLPHDLIENERSERTIQNLWGYGYVDCLFTDGSPLLAGYLAKYMSKGLQDVRLLRKKAYSASRNVLRPVFVSSSEAYSFIEEEVRGVDNSQIYQNSFDTMYLGRCHYKKIIGI